MHKLGDQWIEIIDGVEHMVKAVVGPCERCDVSHICNLGSSCPMNSRLVAKDLGILRHGLLPCPFCGEYGEVTEVEGLFIIPHVCAGGTLVSTEYRKTKQQAIDAWNRRA